MNYDRACKFFYKKLLKKQRVYRNNKLSIVYYYSLTKLYKQIIHIQRFIKFHSEIYWRLN